MTPERDESSVVPDAPTSEPAVTQQNSGAVQGERALAGEDDDAVAEIAGETIDAGSTRTRLGVIPSSYGAPGGSSGANLDDESPPG